MGALSEKHWLEIEALLTVTEAVPVFEAVTVSVLLVPAATLPKSRLALFRDKVPACVAWVAALAELNPWQPSRKGRIVERTNAPATFQRCLEQIAVAGVFRIVQSCNRSPRFSDCLYGGFLSKAFCTPGEVHHESGAVARFATDIRGTVHNGTNGQ